MGFFSWNCKACGHPMLSAHAINKINGWMSEIVVVTKHFSNGKERIFSGEYDGYGRVLIYDTGNPPASPIKVVSSTTNTTSPIRS